MTTPILFPGLGLEFTIDRVAMNLLGRDIYWYGVIIACGFLLAVWFCLKQSKHFGITEDNILDMLFVAVPCSLIGARTYYVLFYQELYRNADGTMDWARAIAIWDGGIAVYGSLIGAVLAAFLFCKIKKIPFLPLADCAAFGLLIGQLIGRWGNFVNQEAFGGPCDALWRMGITVSGVYQEVHPTFLYESLWNLLGLILLFTLVRPRRKFDGQLFATYLFWYGLGRFWIEGLRTDSLYLFQTGIRVSQALALVSSLIALLVLILCLRRQKKNPKPLYVQTLKKKKKPAPVQESDASEKEE